MNTSPAMSHRADLIPVVAAASPRLVLHEAAHAVVATSLDLRVNYVTIEGRLSESQGYMMPIEQSASVLTWVFVYLAGGRAEVKQYGFAEHDGNDLRECRDLLATCFGVPVNDPIVDKELARCTALIDEGLVEDWDWIRAVARELERRRTLTGADVRHMRPTPKGTD